MAKKTAPVDKSIKKRSSRGVKTVANDSDFLASQLAQREAELDIINRIQQGLAAKLDFQTIVDLVGDKIREIFDQADVGIRIYDPITNMVSYPYQFAKGKRVFQRPLPLTEKGFGSHVMRTREALVVNENMAEAQRRFGTEPIPDEPLEKSLVMVPLIVGDQARGTLDLADMEHEHAFGESDVRLLQTLANSMSVALENARLFDETKRLFKAEQQRVAELEIINSIQQGLAAELEFQAIVDLVGNKLREVFNTPNLGITWYDETTNLIHYLYTYEYGKRVTIDPQPPRPGGIFEAFVKTRQPIVINTVEDAKKLNAAIPFPGTAATRSSIEVPIISSDKVLGGISINDFDRENAFGESELRLLTTVSASLGTALENARLFDETQRLLKETEQRAAELAIINSVQEGLASRLEMQAIYELVGDKIRDIFDAQVVDIGLYDRKENVFYFPYNIERGVRFPPSGSIPLMGFRKHVLDTRQYLLINENLPEMARRYGNPLVLRGEAAKSVLYVPMIVGNEVKGVISLQNLDREHAFRDSDVRLLQTLANSMSVALENARLFDETQRLFKAEQERVAELQIINSIQQGLAAELDFQAVIDLVGDKLSEVLHTGDLGIRWYDEETDRIHHLYEFEHGERLTIPPVQPKPGGVFETMTKTRQPIVMRNVEDYAKWKMPIHPGTDQSKSAVYVPIISSDRVLGFITLENYERENAYGESELRLLTTVSASLGTALENARLFDETQRLLKETEQRNAELAIINSVQHGLASKLDMRAIYELIGEKVRQIF
ncbi:MAG TPA: GAF domain-containing protein, partial [Anaerolineales bacterium]|nr:GAF domain-containing protein [Anaerolineales bacterium]